MVSTRRQVEEDLYPSYLKEDGTERVVGHLKEGSIFIDTRELHV